MHFMLVIFIILLCLVLWGFFHANPLGVSRPGLLATNIAILALATIAGAVLGFMLYQDAAVVKAGEKGLATYLGIMAGGTTFLVIVAAGGLARNFVVFPPARRSPTPPGS
jgi:hypothetical protein